MLGVIRETLEEDDESMSGDDDFFSVASTMPLVAGKRLALISPGDAHAYTFDPQGRYTLVYCVQRIFWCSILVPTHDEAL